ncbi:transposase [Nostoc sp.]|uniref:transposase n=1 Tax=Nostoc sp. TaxID=1180 RepID=UPI003FA53832
MSEIEIIKAFTGLQDPRRRAGQRHTLPLCLALPVRDAIESVGAKVKFLPPYSPDLSPIELCWSELKQFLRSSEACTLESRWPCNGSCCKLYY